MAERTISQLTSITTPDNGANLWVQDSSASPPDRRWSVTNMKGVFLGLSDYPSDSSWTTVTSLDNGWTGTVKYIKRAGWVTISVDLDGSSKTGTAFHRMPSGYRPAEVL